MKAKKYLGQHFLNSTKAINSIIKAGQLGQTDLVLEIGPGKGVLTTALLNTECTVFAIEKDWEMVDILKEKFKKEIRNKKLILILGDVLEIDILQIISKHSKPKNKKYKLIANIPYYITGEIIRKFLEIDLKPEKIVLLVQKEVAKRITARDGKESILSLSVKFFGTPKYIETVKAGSFSPPPKVDSAILSIDKIENRDSKISKMFFEVVKNGFAHKRKLLIKNLTQVSMPRATLDTERVGDIFKKCKIPLQTRAEDLKLDNFICITKELL